MKKAILKLALALFLVIPVNLSAGSKSGVVGLVDPPIPEHCEKRGGTIVGGDGLETIAYTSIRCKNEWQFWLVQRAYKDHLKWRVIDVLVIPDRQDGRSVLEGHDGCRHLDQPGYVIVIGKWVAKAHGGYATDIVQAWMPSSDPSQRKFRVVPVDKVACAVDEDRD